MEHQRIKFQGIRTSLGICDGGFKLVCIDRNENKNVRWKKKI